MDQKRSKNSLFRRFDVQTSFSSVFIHCILSRVYSHFTQLEEITVTSSSTSFSTESRCGQYKLFIKKSREFLGDSFKESQNTPIGGRDEPLNVECLRYSYEHACNKSSTGLQRMGRGVIQVSGRTSSPAIQFSRLVLVV